jgi:pyrophosphate--fructose-6-phosphate 1-phosphotransferase
MKIAFLTSGGIAPCLSASIGRLTKNYLNNYPDAEIIGYLNGYKGLLLGNSISFPKSLLGNTDRFYQFGGSPIGNSRVKLTNIDDCIKKGYVKNGENPLTVAANQLVKDGITILHTIGGDDTNTTAADLSNYLKENNYENKPDKFLGRRNASFYRNFFRSDFSPENKPSIVTRINSHGFNF